MYWMWSGSRSRLVVVVVLDEGQGRQALLNHDVAHLCKLVSVQRHANVLVVAYKRADEYASRAGDHLRRGDGPAQAPVPVLGPLHGHALDHEQVDESAQEQAITSFMM